MSAPEMTFTVHPRPASEHPHMIVDDIPAAQAAEVEPQPAPAIEEPAQAGDDRKWDTFRGNLHFLIRYAFGRY